MKKANDELKPCPFCGSSAETGVNLWRLQCQYCGLATPQLTDAEEVINIWDKFCKLFQ